ncbi:MBL fold metallo-hydrolase [Allokutzneria sp. A3M-2-11 16]|uniref:MBL fold metallo-hydrolase n=1 Tax=Allokutzneria sp. A3M-2-11 16 TaxID=2962043 RepID=UPI0020B84DCB|nr:MBL fold metallo-hydrolase [Allokutzneria sp. A3M-2-11 16]MCP3801462.1 MBL fold metallo-hydrolase [Allokutzneria sp. A3M-2-11 16]
MRLTVLGGCGAWPAAGQACSGYLLEHEGFRLLVDPGYAVLPRLLELVEASQVDAVLVSHGHPDHCADLNPLLRARIFADSPVAPLPLYALPGSVDHVLALDAGPRMAKSFTSKDFEAGDSFDIGPFQVDSTLLPHWVPNAGLRLTAGGRTLAYTGDTGPTDALVDLAGGADAFLAEASYPDRVPPESAQYLSSARQAASYAALGGARRLLLTHLWPGVEPGEAVAVARGGFSGEVRVATGGLMIEL